MSPLNNRPMTGLGGYMDARPATAGSPKVSPINEACASVHRELEDLEGLMTTLENRLTPILSPASPDHEEGAALSKLRPEGSPITEDFYRIRQRVDSFSCRITVLLANLEV